MTGSGTITERRREDSGTEADRPQDIPRRGWVEIAKRGWAEAKEDQVPLLAAGVAFYGFLAIWPALIAVVLLYGLIADPTTIADQVSSAADAVPTAVRDVVVEQLRSIASTRRVGAGIGVVVSLALALWSASGGVGNLISAINTAYDERETRTFVRKRLLALGLTIGAVVFMIVMLGLVALLPILFQAVEQGPLRWLVQIIRWVLIAVLVAAALAVLYRLAPDRDAAKFRWVSVGAVLATVLWLLASVGFSVYVTVAGNYAKTYGSLASIVILLFWLWITAYAVLLGAEVNAEAEEQTVRDTTKGPDQPLGRRGAVKADSLPPDTHSSSTRRSNMSSAHPDPEGAADRRELSVPAGSAGAAVPAVHDRAAVPAAADHGSSPPLATLIQQATEESSRLVRTEIRLAQAELTEKAKHAGLGLGAFGVAGVLAWFALGALITTAILALSLVLAGWLAALIVSVVVLIAAGVAVLIGRRQVRAAAPVVPTETVESVKADVDEIKESVRR